MGVIMRVELLHLACYSQLEQEGEDEAEEDGEEE
jgi:hypothetical protein